MNTIILYSSNTGFTKSYAYLLSELLGIECRNIDNFNMWEIDKYKCIIFGSSLNYRRFSRYWKFNWIKKQSDNQKILLFLVGIGNHTKDSLMDRLKIKGVDGIYYIRGGFDYIKLNKKHKTILNIKRKQLERKRNLNFEEEEFLRSISYSIDYISQNHKSCKIINTRVDYSREEYLYPLIENYFKLIGMEGLE